MSVGASEFSPRARKGRVMLAQFQAGDVRMFGGFATR
jgi:hypothetical protein